MKKCLNFVCLGKKKVSGHNATGKTPMYEKPLIFVFGVRGFVLGFWVLAFCHCPEIQEKNWAALSHEWLRYKIGHSYDLIAY